MFKRIVYLAGIALCAAALLGATQCQSNDNGSGIGPDGPVFVTTLAVEDANGNATSNFSSAEQIQLVLSVRNRSNSTQSLQFGDCELTNFVVLNSGTATQVWSSAAGQGFCQHTSDTTWQTGETKTFTVTWNQTDNSGQLVPAGNYEAVGGLVCSNSNANNSASPIQKCMVATNPGPDDLLPSAFISTLIPFTIQ